MSNRALTERELHLIGELRRWADGLDELARVFADKAGERATARAEVYAGTAAVLRAQLTAYVVRAEAEGD